MNLFPLRATAKVPFIRRIISFVISRHCHSYANNPGRDGGSGSDSYANRSIPKYHQLPTLSKPSTEFTFLAIGDFGEPNPDILKTARAMSEWVPRPLFVLGLGDNFYPSGVTDTSDLVFTTHWYDVFIKPYPTLQVPWYHCLGNHDYEGCISSQISFTDDPRNTGRMWNLPATNYSFSVKFGACGKDDQRAIDPESATDNCNSAFSQSVEQQAQPSIDFFCLDTNGVQFSVRKRYPETQELLRQHIASLEDKLSRSTATWKIVFAHHPIYSKGLHHGRLGRVLGREPNAFEDGYNLEDVLVKHGVHAYITGHEHKFQHHWNNGVHHFIGGACGHTNGLYGGIDNSTNVSWCDDHDTNGFLAVKVSATQLQVQFVSNDCRKVIKTVVIEK